MQQCDFHASFQSGFVDAVSTRQFTIGRSTPFAVNPQSIGNDLLFARGGGREHGNDICRTNFTFVVTPLPSYHQTGCKRALFNSSTMGRSSGLISM
jgi:hypothetical protein